MMTKLTVKVKSPVMPQAVGVVEVLDETTEEISLSPVVGDGFAVLDRRLVAFDTEEGTIEAVGIEGVLNVLEVVNVTLLYGGSVRDEAEDEGVGKIQE